MDFELAYYDVTDQHVNHYIMATPNLWVLGRIFMELNGGN